MEALAGGQPLSARARRIARSREEMLGLLADFAGDGDDSDRELSFSDLVEAIGPYAGHVTPVPAQKDRYGSEEAAEQGREDDAVSKQQLVEAAAAGKQRRLRRRRSDSRGSCGGGGDGVLLNFYVPGLLTRSMTAPRSGRGTTPGAPGCTGHGAPAKVAAKKSSRIQAPLSIGCWSSLWGRSRDHRNKPVCR